MDSGFRAIEDSGFYTILDPYSSLWIPDFNSRNLLDSGSGFQIFNFRLSYIEDLACAQALLSSDGARACSQATGEVSS